MIIDWLITITKYLKKERFVMAKKIILGVGIFFLSISTILNSADAGAGGGRRSVPPSVPEPLSCILVLAGGATLAAIRRIKNRRNSKNMKKQDTDSLPS